jgi:hypothetical protein
MKIEKLTILELFSLAIAVGIFSELVGSLQNFDLFFATQLAVALLFLAVPRFNTFTFAAIGFLSIIAARYLYLQPFSLSRHDLPAMYLVLFFLGLHLWQRTKRSSKIKEQDYLNLIILISGFFFFEAGVYKLLNYSVWFNGSLLSELVVYKNIFVSGAASIESPYPWQILSVGTIFFELLFISATWVYFLRIPLVVLAILFHIATFFMLNINFLGYQIGIFLVVLIGECRRRNGLYEEA